MTLYKAQGSLRYTSRYWLILDCDQQIADYYRALMPKYMDVRRPRYGAHITISRPEVEMPSNLVFWRAFEGENIEFYYEPCVRFGESGMYYWLNCFSNRLDELRRDLGLAVEPRDNTPEGFGKTYHMTVANRKHLLDI